MHVCSCVCLWRLEEDVKSQRTGVADNFKPPDVGAGKLFCCKNSESSFQQTPQTSLPFVILDSLSFVFTLGSHLERKGLCLAVGGQAT